jgi:hypothetical protein
MESGNYAGSKVCYQDGAVLFIEGSLSHCPAGFIRSSDPWGNGVCTDGKINAYESCRSPFIETVDRYGQPVCVDNDNNPIIMLSPRLD